MNKKAIAILGAIFILIIGTLGFLIYSNYYGNKDKAPVPVNQTSDTTQTDNTNNNNNDNNNNQPDGDNNNPNPENSNAAAIVKLTDDQVVSPVLFYKGNGVTYFTNEGLLYQWTLENSNGQWSLARKKLLDIPVKPGISKILWPSQGDNFIAEFTTSDGKKSWSFFNSQVGAYTDLPSQVVSFDWMPAGDKILFVWLENGKATMNLGDPDTQNWQAISDMWELDDILKISPDGKNVLYYEANNPKAVNFINQTTPDGKVWKGLVKDGYNYGVLWSPDSQKFLYGTKDSSSQKTELWYYDLLTGVTKDTGLATTPDKAVWSHDSKYFYAAVPASGTLGENSLTVDSFIKVDAASLSKREYQLGSQSVDGRDLFLNLQDTVLFFKNAQDGGLYYLDLNQ